MSESTKIFMCKDKNRECPNNDERCCFHCTIQNDCFNCCDDAELYRYSCDFYEIIYNKKHKVFYFEGLD